MNNTMMLPLTVIILTDRADERLQKAITSVAFAQEILIVSYLKKNDWSDWQANRSVRVLSKQGPITDFARARNEALPLAKHDWVLFLDSDEEIATESVPVISQVIRENNLAGVWCQRQDIFYGRKLRWGEAGTVQLLRLVKKSRVKFKRPVHEIAVVDGITEKVPIVILHSSHTSVNEFLDSIARYARLEADYRWDNGQRFSWFQLVVYPWAKCLVNGLLRLGFMDGWRGMVYVVCMTIHSVLVRVYLYELENYQN